MGGFGGTGSLQQFDLEGNLPLSGPANDRSGFALNAQQQQQLATPAVIPPANQPNAPASQAEQATLTGGYMASLDVELPSRGREYFFTTPRGEIELSAQGVQTHVSKRFFTALTVIITALIAWFVCLAVLKNAGYESRHGDPSRWYLVDPQLPCYCWAICIWLHWPRLSL